MDSHDWRLIKSTPLFASMPDESVADLIGNEPPKVYNKGTVLFRQSEPARFFYIVVDGWVKIFRITFSGEEAVVNMFGRGETFAEAAIFLGAQYPASAEVVSSARLIRVDGERLRSKIHDNPDLAMSMLASASQHLKGLIVQLEQIKHLSASQRVAEFLLRLCSHAQGKCAVTLPYEKGLIAKRLGITPESFSRVLSKMKPLGLSVSGEKIEIEDVQKLAQFARSGDLVTDG